MMKWHLHVTVQPHWSWTLSDVASALRRDIERHEMRPLVITNHFPHAPERSYRELIPSKEIEAPDESDASRMIFHMGVLLNNAGWRVRRLKIEGDARHEPVRQRAMYYECHVRILPEHVPLAREMGLAISTTERSTFATSRHDVYGLVEQRVRDLRCAMTDPPRTEIEAAVLDTNPALDSDWITQR